MRAYLRYMIEMGDADAYERVLDDPQLCPLIVKTYAAWEMKAVSQLFIREGPGLG